MARMINLQVRWRGQALDDGAETAMLEANGLHGAGALTRPTYNEAERYAIDVRRILRSEAQRRGFYPDDGWQIRLVAA